MAGCVAGLRAGLGRDWGGAGLGAGRDWGGAGLGRGVSCRSVADNRRSIHGVVG